MTENKQYLHFQLVIFHSMSFPFASVLLQMTEYYSSWSNRTPLCIHMTFSLPIPLLADT